LIIHNVIYYVNIYEKMHCDSKCKICGKKYDKNKKKRILQENLSEKCILRENSSKKIVLNDFLQDQPTSCLQGKKIYYRPPPPYLPRNFSWCGHYYVPDLNLDVPFTWNGKNGNIQMIAGGPDYPIWFTNLIYDGYLYTLTYKWPGLVGEQKCVKLFPFTIDDLNTIFASSSFVGAEIITTNPICSFKNKERDHEIIEQNIKCTNVHHFRLSIALPKAPPGNHFRLPITSADIYVNQKDPTKFWKILHFGFQNLLDPNLDEWIIMNKFKDIAGEVNLPCECINSSS
jgi:hypothetical protein